MHVSKSEAYLYAVIFDHNNKNFKNGEGPANSLSFFFLGGGGGGAGGARSLEGGEIPRDLALGRAKLGGGEISASPEISSNRRSLNRGSTVIRQ